MSSSVNLYSGLFPRCSYRLMPTIRLFLGQWELILKHWFTVGPKISVMLETELCAAFTEPYVRLIL